MNIDIITITSNNNHNSNNNCNINYVKFTIQHQELFGFSITTGYDHKYRHHLCILTALLLMDLVMAEDVQVSNI